MTVSTKKHASKAKEGESEFKKKWGAKTYSLGWAGIPNILIERQQTLGIDSVDMNILLILIKHWWDKNNNPYPSKKTIAEIIGRDASTVQRHIRGLEEKGVIERKSRFNGKSVGGGQTSNEYDLSNLVKNLNKLAIESIKTKKERNEDDARTRRGKS